MPRNPEESTNVPDTAPPPSALLLIAPGCPHCPQVLETLAQLVKTGKLGSLEVVNVAALPERAATLGVRGVPWTRIGPFVLEGALTAGELGHWAGAVGTEAGMAEYFERLLGTGRLTEVEALVREDPDRLGALARLLAEPETSIHVRVGMGAVLEGLHGTGLAASLVERLGPLTRSAHARVRSDACHYLALIGDRAALPYLEAAQDDPEPEVREIAHESIEALQVAG